MKFEIFINKPFKVEVEASTYEEAISILKSQLPETNSELIQFSQAIESIPLNSSQSDNIEENINDRGVA